MSGIDFSKLEASINAKPEKHGPVTAKVATSFPLNDDQRAAVEAMENFIREKKADFFLLVGAAGVGKTFCIKDLINRLRGRMVFTAPTNKATKVLRESVTTDDYKPDCRTIYSLLGLRLEANGEIKELTTPEEPLDLSKFLAVVVDEASMLNKKLMGYIQQTARDQRIQFIFMGDPAQLPPVGERTSEVWQIENRFELTKVMRHDNQILQLATSVRGKVNHPAPSFNITSDNSAGEGVWKVSQVEFTKRIREAARAGRFSRPNDAKAIAWRNVTVNSLNRVIRAEIFDNTLADWCEGDRLIMLAPAKDHKGDQVAHTDDEGTVTRVTATWHPMYQQFLCYAINVTFDDNHADTVWLVHPDARSEWEHEKARLGHEARGNGRLWKNFWGFVESFHQARHAYAITAHRSQGSTYNAAFVDFRDIMLNRERSEAVRCAYVAFTRPKKELYIA